jgi:hypothetical protein
LESEETADNDFSISTRSRVKLLSLKRRNDNGAGNP